MICTYSVYYLGDQHVLLKALGPGRRLSLPVGHGMARRQLYDRETNSGRSALAAVVHGVHHELRLLHRVVLVGVGVGAWLRVCRWRRTTEEGADDGYRNMICRHRNYLQSAVCPGLRLRVSLLLCTLYTTGSDPNSNQTQQTKTRNLSNQLADRPPSPYRTRKQLTLVLLSLFPSAEYGTC